MTGNWNAVSSFFFLQFSFRGVRSSKFRHIFGSPARRDRCYDNLKITRNAHDGNFCAANPKFVAVVTEVAGGGAFIVIPLERVSGPTGACRSQSPVVCLYCAGFLAFLVLLSVFIPVVQKVTRPLLDECYFICMAVLWLCFGIGLFY